MEHPPAAITMAIIPEKVLGLNCGAIYYSLPIRYWQLGFAEEGGQCDSGDHDYPAEQLLKAGEGTEEHI